MPTVIEHYLAELRRELRHRGVPDRISRQVVEECAFHLLSACEELEAAGRPADDAARETLDRFGAAAYLARDWAEAERTAPPRWCWVVVCPLGLGLGLVASLPIGRWVEAALGMLLILPAVGLVTGAVLGLSQGWALRQRLGWLARWVVGTALGLAIGLTAGTTLVEALGLERGHPLEEAAGLVLIGAVAGTALASAQWQLARRSLAGARVWIVKHGVGTAAGLALGGLLGNLLESASGAPGLALVALGGAAGAAWAGAAELDRLLAARGIAS